MLEVPHQPPPPPESVDETPVLNQSEKIKAQLAKLEAALPKAEPGVNFTERLQAGEVVSDKELVGWLFSTEGLFSVLTPEFWTDPIAGLKRLNETMDVITDPNRVDLETRKKTIQAEGTRALLESWESKPRLGERFKQDK